MQQHAASFFAQAEAAAGADLPQFVEDEFDAFLECGILAHGFLRLRLRCGDCGHDKLVAFTTPAPNARRAELAPSATALPTLPAASLITTVGAGANVLSFGRFQNAEGIAATLA